MKKFLAFVFIIAMLIQLCTLTSAAKAVNYAPADQAGDSISSTADSISLNASLSYTTSPLTSMEDISAQITLEGKPSDYYIEVACSWDNENWFIKDGSNITIKKDSVSVTQDVSICLLLTGSLYTKVVVYDSKGGTKLGEFTKTGTDTISTGSVKKYDWYKFSEKDSTGMEIDIYMSAVGAALYDSTDPVYAFEKRADETVWHEYVLKNGIWIDTGITYDSNPIEDQF